LEGSGEGLDQHCCTDSSSRDADVALGEGEDVVPKTGFLVVLHLGEVEIRTGSSLDELTRIVEEVEGKVEDGTGNWCVVDGHPRLVEMPSSRPEKGLNGYTLRGANGANGTYRTIKTAVFWESLYCLPPVSKSI